jgi:ABC-type branched-subunit amino acid transport system ATPase component
MITLEKLTKIFGTRPAVESLDLTVPKGEIFGLLGHNGAGKSTTIGMLLGQVWPTSGSVLVCGHDVTRNRHDAQALIRVPLRAHLHGHIRPLPRVNAQKNRIGDFKHRIIHLEITYMLDAPPPHLRERTRLCQRTDCSAVPIWVGRYRTLGS